METSRQDREGVGKGDREGGEVDGAHRIFRCGNSWFSWNDDFSRFLGPFPDFAHAERGIKELDDYAAYGRASGFLAGTSWTLAILPEEMAAKERWNRDAGRLELKRELLNEYRDSGYLLALKETLDRICPEPHHSIDIKAQG